jgi:hypothetical protein
MPSTDRKIELKAKTSVAQTDSQPYVYAKGLNSPDVEEALSCIWLFKITHDFSVTQPVHVM